MTRKVTMQRCAYHCCSQTHFFVLNRTACDVKYIWNNSNLNCGCRWKWRMIIAVNSNLSNWKEEAWKYQGFNGIRARDLRDTGAMLYQLSYGATHWERRQFIEFLSPVRSEMMWSNISNTRDSVSSGYPNTEKRVLKIRRAVEHFFDEIRGVRIADETLSRMFDISSQSKQKLRE